MQKGAKQPNWIKELKRLGAIIFIVFYISGAGRFLSQFHIPILDDYLTATERTRYINLDVQEVHAQTLTPSPTPNREVLEEAGIENPSQEAGYIPQVIKEVFGDKAEEAGRVAFCESSHRADAVNRNRNGSVDVGLFQINSIHGQSTEDMRDPVKNAEFAHELYEAQGWRPWRASFKCHGLR